MDYMTVQEAAKEWGISTRRMQQMCVEGRIAGVIRFAKVWMIPKDAVKPADERYKHNKTSAN
jgi:translation initiation factor IF-1